MKALIPALVLIPWAGGLAAMQEAAPDLLNRLADNPSLGLLITFVVWVSYDLAKERVKSKQHETPGQEVQALQQTADAIRQSVDMLRGLADGQAELIKVFGESYRILKDLEKVHDAADVGGRKLVYFPRDHFDQKIGDLATAVSDLCKTVDRIDRRDAERDAKREADRKTA